MLLSFCIDAFRHCAGDLSRQKALLAPSWKYTLNYETEWMTRDRLVDVTYQAAWELNRVKCRHGLLRKKDEMNWPVGIVRFNPLRIIRQALAGNREV